MPPTGPDAIVSAILDQLQERRQAAAGEGERLEAEAAELEELARDRLADAGAQLAPGRNRWLPLGELEAEFVHADRLVARMDKIDRLLGRWRIVRGERRSQELRGERERRGAELRELLIRIAKAAGGQVALRIPELRDLYEQAARYQAESSERRARAFKLQLQVAHIDRDLARHERRLTDRRLEQLRIDHTAS
jgi:hypothetical protein